MLKGVCAHLNPKKTFIVVSGTKCLCKLKSKTNPGIYFYSGLRKNVKGGGDSKGNPLKGGGVQYDPNKCAPPPPPNLKTWIRHCLGYSIIICVLYGNKMKAHGDEI